MPLQFDEYQTRNLPRPNARPLGSPGTVPLGPLDSHTNYYFDGKYGRGLDDTGVKTIYGRHRGIHVEGILGDAGIADAQKAGVAAPGAYPGMCVRVGPQVALMDTNPGVAKSLVLNDERQAFFTGSMAATQKWPGSFAILVEDDIRGAPVNEPYQGGMRVQAEIFTRGMECWLAVKPDVSGGSLATNVGSLLFPDESGTFVGGSVALTEHPFAILLHKVEKEIAGIDADDAHVGLAYCRII